MIPFILFFACAVSSCLLTHSWAGVGIATAAPAEQALGYAGAAMMLLAAYVSAFSLWLGRYMAGFAVAIMGLYCLCENMWVAPRMVNLEAVCSFLLLAGAVVYVFGSFRVHGMQRFLYPREATKAGKVAVGVCIGATALGICWMAYWQNAAEVQRKTVAARWESVKLDRVTSGRRQVKFTALDSSMSVTVASDELFDELQSARKQSVEVQITETFKHGAMVAWEVESIDGSRNFSLLDSQPEKLNQ